MKSEQSRELGFGPTCYKKWMSEQIVSTTALFDMKGEGFGFGPIFYKKWMSEQNVSKIVSYVKGEQNDN